MKFGNFSEFLQLLGIIFLFIPLDCLRFNPQFYKDVSFLSNKNEMKSFLKVSELESKNK